MIVSDILFRYFNAWETHDLSELRNIFHKKARYEILGSRILDGIEQIEGYWSRNAQVQQNVMCSVTRFTTTETSIFAQWKANFFRVDRDAEYHLDGLLWLIVENGKIIELIECYHRNLEFKQARLEK